MASLSIHLGREAARQIEREGWSADLFSLLLGDPYCPTSVAV